MYQAVSHDEKEKAKFDNWFNAPLPWETVDKVSQDTIDDEMRLFRQSTGQGG